MGRGGTRDTSQRPHTLDHGHNVPWRRGFAKRRTSSRTRRRHPSEMRRKDAECFMMKSRLLSLLGRPAVDPPRAKKAVGPSHKTQARPKPYRSVTIVHPAKCCAAVKALAGRRFLAGSARSIPLPACSLPDQCKCSFQKHDDRRDADRRSAGERSKWYGGAEKRRSRDRRRGD